ncbi:hypothetical protein PoB_005241700 [Plakobranchus ocellatus]|uniref:Uncharacterized protein n=1 Tax=Plakobranchus ocellatus TaxID=259542 RepID=A0AAV4C3H8_9GAST|nr:hypothetical protein PoB_005241700 [Plakobranchus ocellatus]
MDRQGGESAKDNLLEPEQCNNIHSADKAEEGQGNFTQHPPQKVDITGLDAAYDDDSIDEDSSSGDHEHHEFPPDSFFREHFLPLMIQLADASVMV